MAEPKLNLASISRLQTLVTQYIAGVADRTVQNTPFLNVLQAAGCIEFNVKGNLFEKCVQFDDKPLTPMSSAGGLTFQNSEFERKLEFRPAGYEMAEAVPMLDVDLGGGSNDYVDDVVEQRLKYLTESALKKIDPELFIDNTVAGYTDRLGGLQSFHKYQSTTAADRVALPSATETYGQQKLALASEGGNWSDELAAADRFNASLTNDWPDGNGDGRYDWNSPIGVNFASSKWKSGATFETNCCEVLESALMWSRARLGNIAGPGMPPMQIMMGATRMREFKTYLRTKYQLNLDTHPFMLSLGIDNAFNYEGASVMTGMSCPSHKIFGWHPADTEFKCTYDKIYKAMGPEWSLKDKAYLIAMFILGRLMFSPRSSFEIANYNA